MITSLEKALTAYEQGKLVGLPTETVYGLAAPIQSPELIDRIFELKERPSFDPLIVHVCKIEQARTLTSKWPEAATKLAENFWPGPLTLVLPRNKELVSDRITAGLDTVGLRFPGHPLACEFIEKLGGPVAAPSANKFTKVSPTRAAHVEKAFGEEVWVIDGGPCQVGLESTIVGFIEEKWILLRPGLISPKQLESVIEEAVEIQPPKDLHSPGSHHTHYRPEFELTLGYGALSKHPHHLQEGHYEVHLPAEAYLAARDLYALLHLELPKGFKACYIELRPEWENDPLWSAILNRLTRAASKDLRGK